MAEPLKNIYDSNYIEKLGQVFAKTHSSFDPLAFVNNVFSEQWEELELKQRISRICLSIYDELQLPFIEACVVLKEVAPHFDGYAALYFPEYVERFGIDFWEESMETLSVLTEFSSAEFAIRPFIVKDCKKAMAQMLKWSHHENEHIRRLSSEGCRPRLPWARAFNDFKKDPSLILPILENLRNDSSRYVQKSVANNLNDISKDNPALALKLAKKWITGATTESKWIVKHGLRTMLKASEPEALNLFGLGDTSALEMNGFQLLTPVVFIGEDLNFQFDLTVKKETKLRIEYALHFRKKKGGHGQKVFKLSEIEVEQGEYEVTKSHSFKKLTTRSFYQGVQFLEIIINGKIFMKTPFFLCIKKREFGSYYIYMIYTQNNTLYTGITTGPNRRFLEHCSSKKGAKYTRGNSPLALVYLESALDRSAALKREAAIKKLSRKEKENLSNCNLLDF